MACQLGSELASKGFKPDGFVLEAPFNRMLDQVMTDSKAQFLSHRGLVDFPILLKEIRMEFDSQVWPTNTVLPAFSYYGFRSTELKLLPEGIYLIFKTFIPPAREIYLLFPL